MKNFKIQEFVCRCGCEMPAEARQNIEALVVNVLDPVRDEYGKPIYVKNHADVFCRCNRAVKRNRRRADEVLRIHARSRRWMIGYN